MSLNVLILGGLTHLARPLLGHLVHLSEDREIKRIRAVDKYLVAGNASSTYIDPDTEAALQDPRVEYRQANLNDASKVSASFDLPNDESFDVVFDLTGEGILGSSCPSQLLLERTTKLAGLLASDAARRRVKAYIRDTPPFWTSKPDEGPWKESDMSSRSLGGGLRPFFYYEAERAVANNEELPVVLLRSAGIYGPHQYHGCVNPRLPLGEVYSFLKEPMKMLWSSDLKVNTLHSRDWCRGAWAAALWCLDRSRPQANKEAGEELPRVTPKDKGKYEGVNIEEDAERCCPRSKTPIAPVFNLVDACNTDQGALLRVVGQVYGIETGFTNAAINTWAKLNLSSVVTEMNEKHAEAMSALISQSNSPVSSSPMSCYLNNDDVAQRAIALDGSKANRVLGWQPKEVFGKETIDEEINSFKKAGTWICS